MIVLCYGKGNNRVLNVAGNSPFKGLSIDDIASQLAQMQDVGNQATSSAKRGKLIEPSSQQTVKCKVDGERVVCSKSERTLKVFLCRLCHRKIKTAREYPVQTVYPHFRKYHKEKQRECFSWVREMKPGTSADNSRKFMNKECQICGWKVNELSQAKVPELTVRKHMIRKHPHIRSEYSIYMVDSKPEIPNKVNPGQPD